MMMTPLSRMFGWNGAGRPGTWDPNVVGLLACLCLFAVANFARPSDEGVASDVESTRALTTSTPLAHHNTTSHKKCYQSPAMLQIVSKSVSFKVHVRSPIEDSAARHVV